MNQTDTIAAIATSSSNGGISVIRMSGEDSLKIIDKVFRSESGKKILSKQKSHTIHYGFICDGEEIIDEVIILLMLAPRSYTKENVIEIDCHGGRLVSMSILELLIKMGARMAEPGEFTKRAFLNGRIDLSQAEAVSDLINAKNRFALKSSISKLRGNLKECIKEIREKICRDIAFIEAALDDPEHMSLEGYSNELSNNIEQYLKILDRLNNNFDNGRRIKEGIRTIILGKPNVGKSSLLNRLLREDRAIVTKIPGTTRDILEEEVEFGDVTLMIIDTAGIRQTDDVIEQMGIEKAKHSLTDADFVITVIDRSCILDENDKNILEMTKNHNGIIVLNKSDLEDITSSQDIVKLTDKKVFDFSAKNNQGLEELEEYIKKIFYQDKILFNDEIYISNMRQKEALLEAIDGLRQVKKSIEMEMSEDFYTIDLMNAYESLGKIIGETVEEDIVDTIFKEFCMGK